MVSQVFFSKLLYLFFCCFTAMTIVLTTSMMTTTTSTTPTDPQVTQCIKMLMVAIAAAAWA